MRLIFALPLLALAGCDVDNDSANDQVRLDYNQQRIEDAATSAGRAVEEVGSGVGNVAATAGRAARNEIGDIDVDVDVKRDRSQGAAANESAGN